MENMEAKLQNAGPLIYILLNHNNAYIVFRFVLQKVLTPVKQVVQSGPAFCSCSNLDSGIQKKNRNWNLNKNRTGTRVTDNSCSSRAFHFCYYPLLFD